MTFRFLKKLILMAIVASCFTATAHAGRSCEPKRATVRSIEQGLTLAEKTMTMLDASGSDVVLLARAGQDLSKYGLRYSHLGFAYRQSQTGGGHVWRVVHKLNECGTATSALHRQGLGEFFLDDPWRYEAAYVVPSEPVQRRLLALLQDEAATVRLHHRPYSIVSYVWGTRYQQSNQWAIETMASAMVADVDSREKAQDWLVMSDYRPTTLELGPMTRIGARMTASNVAFDDHPPAKRFSNQIETVTVDSVFFPGLAALAWAGKWSRLRSPKPGTRTNESHHLPSSIG